MRERDLMWTISFVRGIKSRRMDIVKVEVRSSAQRAADSANLSTGHIVAKQGLSGVRNVRNHAMINVRTVTRRMRRTKPKFQRHG